MRLACAADRCRAVWEGGHGRIWCRVGPGHLNSGLYHGCLAVVNVVDGCEGRKGWQIRSGRPSLSILLGLAYGELVRGRSGGMADATDSKSVARKGVWVQVPPPAFEITGSQTTVYELRGHTASNR